MIWGGDLHNTFLTLAKGKKSENYEKSVLTDALPSGRTCKDIPSYWRHHCSCEWMKGVMKWMFNYFYKMY